MKKLLSVLLSLVILITSLSIGFTAFAEDTKGYAQNPFYTGELSTELFKPLKATANTSKLYYTHNGKKYYEEGDALYKILRDALGARQEVVKLRIFSSGQIYNSRNILGRLFQEATEDSISISSTDGDYARWSVTGYAWDYDVSRDSNGYYYDFEIEYKYYATEEQEQAVSNKINSIVNTVRSRNYSDYQAVKYIHDLICNSTTYDYAAVENATDKTFSYAFTAYGALIKGRVVCQGYANAFYRICKELGYNVRFVSSSPYEGCHAWNLIQLDDKYYFVDATWDDEIKDDPSIIEEFESEDVDEYFYFLVDYDKLRSEDTVRQHTLYSELYDNSYYEKNYGNKTSKEPYDVSTAKGLSNCKISLSQIKFNYNGEKQSPVYTITDKDGNEMKSFSVSYVNRINCGRVLAKITGKGDYEGYETYRTYIIVPGQMTRLYYSQYSRTSSSLELEWDEYDGKADGYQIQQYKNGEWKTIKTVGKTFYAKITGLSPAKDYKFRIRAYKIINNYKYYGTPSKVFTNFTLPNNVKAPTLSTKSKAITVKWNKVTCSGYEIQYAKGTSNMSNAKKVTVSNSASSKKITGLVKGRRYYVRIRAYKTFNGKKYYSDWSSKKSIIVK